MGKRYEYKLIQTIDGRSKEKEGVTLAESNQQVMRDLAGKVRDNATAWSMVVNLETGE